MRLYALDIFRFIAALGVVLYHYTARSEANYFPDLAKYTQFGYLGVPLFFMISGFVISASAQNRKPLEFLISRAARLYPAFWMGIAFTTLITWSFADTIAPSTQILANITMINDYFGIKNIDGVYWTLQTELKFYACIFLLLITGMFCKYHYWLPAWAIATTTNIFTGVPSNMGAFISPSYSCYFISGICFYLIWINQKSVIITFTLLLSSCLSLYQSTQQAPGFMALASSNDYLTSAIIVLCFHGLFLALALQKLDIKPNKIYITLGGITYPLYLIHNQAGKTIIDSFPNLDKGVIVTLTLLAALIASFLIHKYFEEKAAQRLRQLLFQALNQKIKQPIDPKI